MPVLIGGDSSQPVDVSAEIASAIATTVPTIIADTLPFSVPSTVAELVAAVNDPSIGTVYLNSQPDNATEWDIGSDTLVMYGGKQLRGAGRDHTIIRATGPDGGIHLNDGQLSSNDGGTTQNVKLADFSLNGLVGAVKTGAYGLVLGNAAGVASSPRGAAATVQDVTIRGFATAGIRAISCQVNALFQRVQARENDTGMIGEAGTGNTTAEFQSCSFNQNRRGMDIRDWRDAVFMNCGWENNTEEGFIVEAGPSRSIRDLLWLGGHMEGNNAGRSGTGHAQFILRSLDSSAIQNAVMLLLKVGDAGAGNFHGAVHGAVLTMLWPLPLNPATGSPWLHLPGASVTHEGVALGSATTSVQYMGGEDPTTDFTVSAVGTNRVIVSRFDRSTSRPQLQVYGSAVGVMARNLRVAGDQLGLYGATAASKPTVTGSRGGNAAVADALTDLAAVGIITDGSSA